MKEERVETMSRRQESLDSPANTTKLAEGDLSLRVFHEVDENTARRKHHFLVGGDQQVHHHLVNCNTHARVCVVLRTRSNMMTSQLTLRLADEVAHGVVTCQVSEHAQSGCQDVDVIAANEATENCK